MKLRLNKSQRTGGMMSKKVIFSLAAQVDLTAQEQEYVKKYKMGNELVYAKNRVEYAPKGDTSVGGFFRDMSASILNLTLTVDDLVIGRTIECKDITEMIYVEDMIKSGCTILRELLDACSGFEGEEVIEY